MSCPLVGFFKHPRLHFRHVFSLSWQAWASLLFRRVMLRVAYIFWYDALYVLPASQVGVFMYLNPLTATATAVVLLGETLSPRDIAGASLVALGLWLVNKKSKHDLSS